MRENLLLDLARINVRSTGNIHIRGASGDVEEALLIEVTEITGAKPAITKRLRIRLGVIVVAGEHREPADANLSYFTGPKFAAIIVLDRNLHCGAFITAGADLYARSILGLVQLRREDRNISGHLAQAEILDEHFPELHERCLLVLAILWRARIGH